MPKNGRQWTFNATVSTRDGSKKTVTLVQLMDIPIERHVKVRGTASCDDPKLKEYWTKRQLIMVVQIARRILYTCIRSVTNIYTEWVKSTSCWRLERLDGKLSRAVLRGGEHGDVLPLTRLGAEFPQGNLATLQR